MIQDLFSNTFELDGLFDVKISLCCPRCPLIVHLILNVNRNKQMCSLTDRVFQEMMVHQDPKEFQAVMELKYVPVLTSK